MVRAKDTLKVYLEVGRTKVFAGAIDWPGWCRAGRDKDAALAALLAAGPRYSRVLRGTRLGFQPLSDVRGLRVVEKLKGDATTDFGAPGIAPSVDKKAVGESDLRRYHTILKACWRAFDAALEAASGRELRKGPRGGGRDPEGIVEHVLGSEVGYLASLGWKAPPTKEVNFSTRAQSIRRAVAQGLEASAQGLIPPRGPRGGVRWTARYFVRRLAWHVLDHAWEIEDRIL
jgi:hypothetical protein